MNINRKNTSRGSSLIGMAFFIVVLGFLITGAIYMFQNYDLIHSDQESVDNSRSVELALDDFMEREGRLPMPAPLDAAMDSSTYGLEQAALVSGTYRMLGRDGKFVRVGAIPTRTLNISDKIMFDGYGKRYVYAVTEDMTNTSADIRHDLGAISLKNVTGPSASEIAAGISLSDIDGTISYALISLGDSDKGAFNEDGTLIAPCSGTGLAAQNCSFLNGTNNPAQFVTTGEKTFGMGDSSFTHKFTFQSNAIPYKWNVAAWNDCAGVCFSGAQDRPVSCVNNRSEVVAETNCAHTPKPDTNRLCALPPCYWDIDPWGGCNLVGKFGGSCQL